MPTADIRRNLCGNCLMPLSGMYCAACGQKRRSSVRHFGQLLGEFFNDVLNLDAKLLRTFKPLLLRPGFLSLEYFADRRMRYVSPVKLYFFISIVAFFLIQQSVEVATGGGQLRITDGDAKAEVQNFTVGNFNGRPWSADSNPIALTWLPDAGNDLINERLGRLERTVKDKDWPQLIHAALTATPQALLILLPFFALLLKLAYLFRKRLYMEHLIVALHNHAFLLLAISLLAVFAEMASWPTALPGWSALLAFATSLLLAWVPLYFLLGLKRIYRQSWKMTVFKFLLIGFCYLNLLGLGLIINVLLGLLML